MWGPLAELGANRRGHLGFYRSAVTPRCAGAHQGGVLLNQQLVASWQRSSWTCRPAWPPFLALQEQTDPSGAAVVELTSARQRCIPLSLMRPRYRADQAVEALSPCR